MVAVTDLEVLDCRNRPMVYRNTIRYMLRSENNGKNHGMELAQVILDRSP